MMEVELKKEKEHHKNSRQLEGFYDLVNNDSYIEQRVKFHINRHDT